MLPPDKRDGELIWDEEQLVADVEAGPQGPRIGAFFDFDGTLIDGYSLAAFARHHLRSGHVTPVDLGRLLLIGLRGVTSEADFERFFLLGMRAWTGRSAEELTELGERLWLRGIAGSLYPEAWRLVEAHRRAGHTVVLASSGTRFQVAPAAAAMGVEHVLVTPVEIEDGLCTGRPGGPPLWRSGKAAAVRAFAREHGVDLIDSYAYSNGDEDVPFLATVGRARALNPGPDLAVEAAQKNWPIARFRSRGRPGAREVARTAGAVGGTLGGFAAGLALGALNAFAGDGSRRDAVDLGLTLAGELGTALGGVRLDVCGGEHLEAARPAVFLFNHQSQLDVLILAKLLRSGFTAVAKKEAAAVPGFGLAFRLADVAFVDRGDTVAAKAALAPAVQRLREGVSLVVAPEGTRSATPALGPFKKGAFHIAMQAGVPVVPIVIRNAGELMWRGASTLRPGTVRVRVLPPIPTGGWSVPDLDEHVVEVRERFVAALAGGDPTDRGPRRAGPVEVTTGPRGPVAEPLAVLRSPEMTAAEAATWRAEVADPLRRATVTLLELLDRAPDRARLVGAHEWASRMVPRMRERPVEPPFGLGAPEWVPVADLDLDRHLSHVRLPAPGSMRQLLDAVQTFAAAPLPRDRPLWRALLVEGLEGGRAAYSVTTHQSVTDELGIVQVMGMLHSRSPDPDPERPEPPARPGSAPSPVGRLGRAVLAAPGAVLRAGPDLVGALLALVPPGASDGSPALARRSGAWSLEVIDVPLDGLRAGARAAGGSLADGVVAAVLGGLRWYHEHIGATGVSAVPVGVSLGPSDDRQGRGTVRVSAALIERDAAARVRAVREAVLTADPDAGPPPDVRVGTLPGVGDPTFLAGARITGVYAFGPLLGAAAAVGLLAHGGTGCLALTFDPAAVTDAAALVEGVRAGVAEVVALGA
ncbi:HAD-IB family hydrolase [Pseudonocardia nigra]|uniref:HAD-IB family hydrolase n=1 Tax=Pseudonocardia nigra TaxID=1921578 RepID=UPI001C605574|nr:HAD-IB family hydrolase [Pseudonocardia nigra]